MAILFVIGINDQSTIRASINANNHISHMYDGNCSIQQQLDLKEESAAFAVLFGKSVIQQGFDFRKKPSLIVNQIANADTHRGALERCAELCAQVDAPVINRPESVLGTTRERVSALLQGIPGVTMPKTVRFNPGSPDEVFRRAASENFAFPFMVRMAGDHGGTSTLRVNNRGDYPALHVYPFDGRDFYLTEFVDCRDDSGMYHRQRLILIDGEPVLRGSLYDENWMVHGASRRFMMQRESWEQDRVRSKTLETEVIPQLKPALAEITNRLQLDIYGIDCSLSPAGEMLIFEANPSMDFLTNEHPQMNARMEMIKGRILAMLERHSGEKLRHNA
ncbi:MAG TPA: hypothetical protein VI566_13680 [Xanthomonadales bacterium]|nr:hypothetical protein [Xanthomonadales bacterium]